MKRTQNNKGPGLHECITYLGCVCCVWDGWGVKGQGGCGTFFFGSLEKQVSIRPMFCLLKYSDGSRRVADTVRKQMQDTLMHDLMLKI